MALFKNPESVNKDSWNPGLLISRESKDIPDASECNVQKSGNDRW
jgi:hypothetical protein